jgi:hypothetical protein
MNKAFPSKKFEEDDPFSLVGVRYPTESDRENDLEMARCFIEEYALMGWAGSQIRLLFESPAYAGPHAIYQRWGADSVEHLIATVFGEEVNDGTGP